MTIYALPVVVTIFVWWFSTGIVLLLDRLPRRTHFVSMLIVTLLAFASIYALIQTRFVTTPLAVYEAFIAGILIWGWLELAFLLGIITGPRRLGCPHGVSSRQRFWFAVQALAYHELTILFMLIVIALICWGAPNQTGLWTFSILFGMRLSAKLNIFLGVPHINEEFLPARLEFLKSYFARRPMNWLFPVSVSLSMLVGAYVFHAAFEQGVTPHQVCAYMLAGTLILLGTLEHWLLIVRLPDSELWRWAMRKEDKHDKKGGSEKRDNGGAAHQT